jgi:hypothetical protein
MGRKPAERWMRRGAAVASWVVAASLAQGLVGADIGTAAHRIEERIEERVLRHGAPPPVEQPQRSHEVESIEPWELVSV